MTADARTEDRTSSSRAGLKLLFGSGDRPDRAAVSAAIQELPRAAITHDPSAHDGARHPADRASPSRGGGEWLELLLDGLTFDLLGLAPGPDLRAPEIAYRFDVDPADFADSETVGLFPGPHIASGISSLPIMRTLLGLGAGLVDNLGGVQAICWTPARTAIAPDFFVRTVRSWLEGGAFPALGIVGFAFDEQGALRSEGLGFLTDCELSIDPPLATDRTAATQLAVRLVHQLVGTDLPSEPREFETEQGEVLVLVPDTAAGEIRVCRAQT